MSKSHAIAAAQAALHTVVRQLGATEAQLVALVEATLKNDIAAVTEASAALERGAEHLSVAAAAAALAVARREDALASRVLDTLVDEVKAAGKRVREAQDAAKTVVTKARTFQAAYSQALLGPTAQPATGRGAGYTRRAAVAPVASSAGLLRSATV
jgi:N-acetylglucosamine kinase-like BadF-type ATPase